MKKTLSSINGATRIGAGVKRHAFTLIEVLAVMLFMAIVVPAAVQGVRIAAQSGNLAKHKRIATELAENILTEKVATSDWINGQRKGDFGKNRPSYRWELEAENWTEEPMWILTCKVYYFSQGREKNVQLSTLALDEESVAE